MKSSTKAAAQLGELIKRGNRMKENNELHLNDPKDAREFLEKSLPEVVPGFCCVRLESGRELFIKDMSDSEVVQYAIELLPIYQAKYPELVNETSEH
jgi:hypothetical protein